jgi:Mrp family chromosome partitioning ATPase/uncharacterized protein involved in exopolysaccharide biosynthesis
MTNKTVTPAAPPTIRIGDLYYVIFRHKWKILLISMLGAAVAGYLYLTDWQKTYMSQAKLFVKYVVEARKPTLTSANEGMKSVEESPIATEIEILTSMDVATLAASRLDPSTKAKLGGDPLDAIQRGLKVDAPRRSSVIDVSFEHPNPQVVTPVLKEVIDAYYTKHESVHQAGGVFDRLLDTQNTEWKEKLRKTEEELRKAKASLGVVSLEDSKKQHVGRIQELEQDIFDAKTELAVAESTIRMLLAGDAQTNRPSQTPIGGVVPPEKVADYAKVRATLETLQRKEQEQMVYYTAESTMMKTLKEQIQAREKEKFELERQYPTLLMKMAEGQQGQTTRTDPFAQAVFMTNSLSIKIAKLVEQLTYYTNQVRKFEQAEAQITDLQRQKELDEQNYRYFSVSWEQSQIDARVQGEARNANISRIQEPSVAFEVPSKRKKTIMMILLGSIMGSLGLAFLLEYVVDRSFRRPVEVENHLGLPLFISIPRMKLNGQLRSLAAGGSQKLIADRKNGAGEASTGALERRKPEQSAPWEPSPALSPFAETLRDRLITYFEMKNLTHKPKLVAVTSCGEGSGVSTISAGLAASLSETGEGNVLLVDMNLHNGAAHQFHRGELACGLDEALQRERREEALVQDKLYMVSEAGKNNDVPSMLPNRFKHLVPRLKTSDYDYIIFDMPPVSQISMTPRLAKFMDMVLMVVESEKTDRDVVKKATSLLSESKTNVGVVLNKSRQYVPKALQQELA